MGCQLPSCPPPPHDAPKTILAHAPLLPSTKGSRCVSCAPGAPPACLHSCQGRGWAPLLPPPRRRSRATTPGGRSTDADPAAFGMLRHGQEARTRALHRVPAVHALLLVDVQQQVCPRMARPRTMREERALSRRRTRYLDVTGSTSCCIWHLVARVILRRPMRPRQRVDLVRPLHCHTQR